MQRRFYTAKWMHRVFAFLNAWVDLAGSVAAILTFGFYCPPWGMDIRLWQLDKQVKERKELRKRDKERSNRGIEQI